MNQARLRWLLGVMIVLVLMRLWDWRGGDRAAQLSEAVVRRGESIAAVEQRSNPGTSPQPMVKSQRELDDGEPRNAFAVRTPPPPPAPPKAIAPVPPIVKPFVGPMPAPPPPPPPPPPFQVIGTWEDATGVSVFLTGPRRTLHARTGDVLLNEYRVIRVNSRELVLRKLASNEDVHLAVPMLSSAAVAIRP